MGEDIEATTHRGDEDTTRTRIRILTERQLWMDQIWSKLIVIAGVVTALGALASTIAFAVGRASKDDLDSAAQRLIKVEQAKVDHEREHVIMEHTITANSQRADKHFDTIDVKLDRLFDQSVATAHRVGARELPAPPKHKKENTP